MEFKQRITLEGAEEVIRQLKQIGFTGTVSFEQLKAGVDANNSALAKISNTVNSTQQTVLKLGQSFQSASVAVAPFSENISTLLGLLGRFAGPAGVLGAAGALVLFVKNAADSVTQLDRNSRALGLTLAQYQAVTKAARAAGLTAEDVSTGLIRFSQQVQQAAQDQFKGIVDLIKQLSELRGVGANTIAPRTLADFQKFRELAEVAAPRVQELARQAGNLRIANQNVSQLAFEMARLANQTTPAGAEMRRLLESATGLDAALTIFEKLDSLVVKNQAGLKSLRLTFTDATGAQVDTFTALVKAAEQIQKIQNPIQRTAAAAKAFGRSLGPEFAQAIADAINAGKLGAEAIEEAFIKSGLASKDTIDKARQVRQAFIDLETATKGAQTELLRLFGSDLANQINKAIEDVRNFRRLFSGDFTNLKFLFSVEVDTQKLKERGEKAGRAFRLGFDTVVRGASGGGQQGTGPISGLGASVQAVFDNLKLIAQSAFQFIAGLPTQLADSVKSALQLIIDLFTGFSAQLASAVSGLAEVLAAPFRAWFDIVKDIVDSILGFIRKVASGLSNSTQEEGVTGGEFASGGFVRGPGTGTSDSIVARLGRGLIRVSNGEFIVRADAVRDLMRRYGSGIMWAINRGELPMPKFSLGGFADRVNESLSAMAMPRFAGGGLLDNMAMAGGGGSQVFLSINGGKNIGPFTGPEDVVRTLTRAAVSSNMFSAQRRQSSVR